MRFVSPFLKKVLYPGLANTGYFGWRRLAGNLCVVTYHGVLPEGYESKDAMLDGNLVSAGVLRTQIRLLKRHYRVVTPEDILQWLESGTGLPPRSVLLTCDDGLQNVLSGMLPVLRDEGVSCLFFVTGASAGDCAAMLWYEELYLLLMAAPPGALNVPDMKLSTGLGDLHQRRLLWWDWVKQLSRYDAAGRQKFLEEVREQADLREDWKSAYQTGPARQRFCLLTAGELRQLSQAGMSIGAHTMSHPMLTQSPADVVWDEMTRSREALNRVVEIPVWAMAYPFGDPASAGAREFEMAERAGYKCAFLNFGGGFGADLPRFAIPRVHVTAGMSLAEFEAHVSGFHESLRRLGRQGARPCA